MKDYQKLYQEKRVTLDEALSRIHSGDRVVAGGAANIPSTLLGGLHTIAGRVENVHVYHTGAVRGRYQYSVDPAMKGHFNVYASFYNDVCREVQHQGVVSYHPLQVDTGSARVLELGPVDVFLVAVSGMNKHGQCKVSLSTLAETQYIYTAKKIIMEVNPNLPDTQGEVEIPIERIDCLVEAEKPLVYVPELELSETDLAIGRNVAALVEDGSTIQLGIGNIPNACAKAFRDKNDLGVHSEMLTTSMAELAMDGVITGWRKSMYRGKMVGCFAMGTQELYDFMDGNSAVWLLSGDHVNDPAVIARQEKMVSINTALQVDLTGQVCAESIGPIQFSGIGGAENFAVGASHSPGGKSIVALRSTAKKGTISTIQPILTPGSIVSIGRTNVDYVVTEYGAARLRGLNVQERVENLLAIAHPDFRDQLRQKAIELQITAW